MSSASSSTQVDDAKAPGSYEKSPGTSDHGHIYEFRMAALMALRLVSPDFEDGAIAFNVKDCGAFDDLVLYSKMKGKNIRTISLVQLKHKDETKNIQLDNLPSYTKTNGSKKRMIPQVQLKPEDIQLDDFIKNDRELPKPYFPLTKYSNSVKTMLKNKFQMVKNMFQDKNYCNIEFILYTNRDADVSVNSTACTFLKCYRSDHFLKTNSDNCKVYRFDRESKDLKSYPISFLTRLFCFVKQADLNMVYQLILEEFRKISLNVDKNVN